MEMGRKQKQTAFIPRHADEYDLKIAARDTNSAVESVLSRFCIVFGSEESDGNAQSRKRKRANNVKYFASFRADNYKAHLRVQHPSKRAESLRINGDGAAAPKFFNTDVPFVNKLDAHFETEQPLL